MYKEFPAVKKEKTRGRCGLMVMALDCGAGGHKFKPRLASFFYRVAIFTNSFAIDEKRKERRGIVQKRAFMPGRCGDDRVLTT